MNKNFLHITADPGQKKKDFQRELEKFLRESARGEVVGVHEGESFVVKDKAPEITVSENENILDFAMRLSQESEKEQRKVIGVFRRNISLIFTDKEVVVIEDCLPSNFPEHSDQTRYFSQQVLDLSQNTHFHVRAICDSQGSSYLIPNDVTGLTLEMLLPEEISDAEEARRNYLKSLDKDKLLKDLVNVGPNKPVGYLPIDTLEELGIDVNGLVQELEGKSLTVRKQRNSIYPDSNICLFVYDFKALKSLLESNKRILDKYNWPSDPDAFVGFLKFIAEKGELFDLVADAFGDKTNPGRTLTRCD